MTESFHLHSKLAFYNPLEKWDPRGPFFGVCFLYLLSLSFFGVLGINELTLRLLIHRLFFLSLPASHFLRLSESTVFDLASRHHVFKPYTPLNPGLFGTWHIQSNSGSPFISILNPNLTTIHTNLISESHARRPPRSGPPGATTFANVLFESQ